MTIRISNQETSSTHKASDNSFNLRQFMQCILMHPTGMDS